MPRIFAFLTVFLVVPAVHAEECRKLKPDGGYKELTAILECLENRVQELEASKSGSRTQQPSVTAAIPSDAVWVPGKCLPYDVKQAFKATITIDQSREELSLCWKDGTVMAKVRGFSFTGSGLLIADPANTMARSQAANARSRNSCQFNIGCVINLPSATVSFRPELLAESGGRKLARLHIESRPN